MKKVVVEYIIGLCDWLDNNNVKWEQAGEIENQQVAIIYKTEDELFRIGFYFGKFYQRESE